MTSTPADPARRAPAEALELLKQYGFECLKYGGMVPTREGLEREAMGMAYEAVVSAIEQMAPVSPDEVVVRREDLARVMAHVGHADNAASLGDPHPWPDEVTLASYRAILAAVTAAQDENP